MKKILVINGPNLNILEKRESEYPKVRYKDLVAKIKSYAKTTGIKISAKQSNHEGEIIELIQKANKYDGIIINAAAYSHTSIGILDALKTFKKPIIEVHLTDTQKREEYRRFSYISEIATKTILGKGIDGYKRAIDEFK